MCDFIQNYIKDGKYIHTSEVYPSCVFPHGSVSTGNTVITSTYECGNPGKFLQKNFTTVSLNSEEGTVTQIQKYDIECAWLLATTT